MGEALSLLFVMLPKWLTTTSSRSRIV